MASQFPSLENPYPGPLLNSTESSARPDSGFTDYNHTHLPYHFSGSRQSPYGPHQSSQPSQGANYHQHSRMSPYPSFSAHLPGYPVNGYFHPQADNAMLRSALGPPLATSPYQSPLPHNPHAVLSSSQSNVDVLPMIAPLVPNGPQGFNMPPYLPTGPMHSYNSFQGRIPVPPSGRYGNSTPHAGQGRGPPRNFHGSNSDPPRHVASPNRRPYYERPNQPSSTGADRPPLAFVNVHSRRSDRSVSPRTNNRRSFDRYATDLGPSSPSSEESEAVSRVRLIALQRRQERRQALARRAHYVVDPNMATPAQMQALRDKLRHFLPHELPEDASTMCDICQKDYSTKHIIPSEEEEVAIQLPCKHIFGEHCINTWFDTCQKHKNKVTCPMCRKLLVEPISRTPFFVPGSPDHLMDLLARGMHHRQPFSQEEGNVLQFSRTEGETRANFDHF